MKFLFKLSGIIFGLLLFVFMLSLLIFVIKKIFYGDDEGAPTTNHVTVLELKGIIMTSDSLLEKLKKVLKNSRTKAIVLRVNSPGGIVAPSQELFLAFKKANEKIPVIVSMASLAASGGYYVSLSGQKIFANPGTLTGSIGVIMEFMNVEKLYHWIKLDRFTLTSGKFKDAGSPLRAMTQEEKKLFKDMIDDIYKQFREEVKNQRHLEDEELDKVADGRVLTGTQAFNHHLVDSLGGLNEAIAEAKNIARLKKDAPVWFDTDSYSFFGIEIPKERIQSLLSQQFFSLIKNLFRGQASHTIEEGMVQSLSHLQGWNEGWNVFYLAPLKTP